MKIEVNLPSAKGALEFLRENEIRIWQLGALVGFTATLYRLAADNNVTVARIVFLIFTGLTIAITSAHRADRRY